MGCADSTQVKQVQYKTISNKNITTEVSRTNIAVQPILNDEPKPSTNIAQVFIDSSCPDFSKIQIQNDLAIAKGDFLDIFGSKKLQGQSSYTLTFSKIGKNNVSLGIIDISNKKLYGKQWNRNRISYGNEGYCFYGKLGQEKLGNGYKVGEEVTVAVDMNLGTVQWKVGSDVRCQISSSLLKNKKIVWVPYILFGSEGDSVKIGGLRL